MVHWELMEGEDEKEDGRGGEGRRKERWEGEETK